MCIVLLLVLLLGDDDDEKSLPSADEDDIAFKVWKTSFLLSFIIFLLFSRVTDSLFAISFDTCCCCADALSTTGRFSADIGPVATIIIIKRIIQDLKDDTIVVVCFELKFFVFLLLFLILFTSY